ncbi:hypothetical protein SL1157_0730 [Ruegeria lacuscaerulensis ITI-1157]|nr:hypothetical protein SL1157_0730 [Ruegeria lacuscaerulensis ITI-1157]
MPEVPVAALRPDEDPADFTVSLCQVKHQVGIKISLTKSNGSGANNCMWPMRWSTRPRVR